MRTTLMIVEELQYPRWMYSATLPARIFNSEVELELAGGDWHDITAPIEAAPEVKPAKKSKKAGE